jgi:hypothetical protein
MIEIEVDTPNNADLYFEPLAERVRGAFQPARVRQASAGALAMALPAGLPGQRILLDVDKAEGAVVEPLAAPDHAATRAAVARVLTGDEGATADRVTFAPAVRVFPGVHVPTWTAHMAKAVRAGLARVVRGQLPKDPPADARPRVFSSLSRPKDEAKPASLSDLLTALSRLSPAERKELAAALTAK